MIWFNDTFQMCFVNINDTELKSFAVIITGLHRTFTVDTFSHKAHLIWLITQIYI